MVVSENWARTCVRYGAITIASVEKVIALYKPFDGTDAWTRCTLERQKKWGVVCDAVSDVEVAWHAEVPEDWEWPLIDLKHFEGSRMLLRVNVIEARLQRLRAEYTAAQRLVADPALVIAESLATALVSALSLLREKHPPQYAAYVSGDIVQAVSDT